jgi:hypothetical protein
MRARTCTTRCAGIETAGYWHIRAMLEWIEMDYGGLVLAEEHVHAGIANLLASPVLSQATWPRTPQIIAHQRGPQSGRA